jgi:seryl-tRNA synthetase
MAIDIGFLDLVQYGAIGGLLMYFIVQDYKDRSHRRLKENSDAAERQQKDKESAKREQDCIKASEEIRKHQMEVIAPLMHTSNQLHKAILNFLKNNKFQTPLPDIRIAENETPSPSDTIDEDTRIIYRKTK